MTERLTPTGYALRVALDGPFHHIKQHWRDTVHPSDVVREPSTCMADAREWALTKLVSLANPVPAVGERDHLRQVARHRGVLASDPKPSKPDESFL